MGLLLKLAFLVLAWWTCEGTAQCNEDGHCNDGFYCENHKCRECLSCKDFKREALSNPASCVKSVVECGPCLKGFAVDTGSDVNAACVPPQTSFSTTWIVTIIVVAVILFVLGCVFILHILRKKGILKMHAYLGASVESQSELPRPSAPAEAPPPYVRYDASHAANGGVESGAKPEERPANGNGALQPQPEPQSRAASPYEGLNAYSVNEASQPFIKRASPPPTSRSRAAAGLQDARVYNRPAYHYPSHPESTYTDDADHSVNVHEEETMESPWTPTLELADSGNASVPEVVVTDGVASGLSEQLDAARGTVLVRQPRDLHPQAPPPKKKCFPHDSNNNGNQAGSGEPSMSGGSASASATTTAIKVNMQATLQLNTVHQHDSVHRHPPYNGDHFPR